MYSDKSWDASGRSEFIKRCHEHADQPDELAKILYIALSQVVNGNLKATSMVNCLREVSRLSNQVVVLLSDALAALDVETLASDHNKHRGCFINLLSACSNSLIADFILRERFDFDTTAEAKIIPSQKLAQTKFIKIKTKLFYKQQKFNLFREESEGYSKLITELCHPEGFSCDLMLQNLRSLIGCFNLDPNRVLDVVVECFEYQPHQAHIYIPLLQKFLTNPTTLAQILAFKFSLYHKEDAGLVTPASLYEVTALILQAKLITLDQIYDYLIPTDQSIYKYYENDLDQARAYAKKIIVPTDDKPEEDNLSKFERFSLIENNQKLGLCSALLKTGDYVLAKQVICKLPDFYAVSNSTISMQLCILVHYAIDIIYHSLSGLSPFIINKIKPYECKYKPLLKQATKVEELRDEVFPILTTLGPFLSYDTLLMTKIVRIGKSIMSSDAAENLKYDLLNLLDEVILPSMALIDSNCALADELWQFLKHFHYSARYTLYSNWKREPQLAVLYRTRSDAFRRIKYIMKRLSKDNVKFTGRQIGKLSHSNPSFLFDYITKHVQSYDNLIGPVVDSLKYLTPLSYDLIIYCIIESLADPAKSRTQYDGGSISPWLLSLANFTGSVVKKYTVDIPGLLQLIANQLKLEKSLDLLVLKEIIQKMAGIESTEEVTNDQLLAMSGGELLKAEGGYFNQVRNTKKSSVRLKDALLKSNLAMPLCILMAQQRSCILYGEQENSHIKLVGKLYDQCQETLVQYGSFLACNLSIDDYIGRLPTLDKLITEYHLSADLAFFFIRPMIVYNINMKYEELRRNEKTTKDSLLYIEAWEHVTKALVDSIMPAFSRNFWDDLSPRFYVTFWTLSMYDLEVPKVSYDVQMERLRSQIQQTEETKELNVSKKKKEIERYRLLIEKLSEEMVRQSSHVRRVKQRLEKEMSQWFQSKLAKMEMTTHFLRHCLFPRCLFTANDALYCAKFVHLLHCIKTPNFSTLICYDRIFGDISYTLSSCTENEANHYGRFLSALLETVMRWHKEEAAFNRECAKYPGFVTKFFDKQPTHVDYESYRHVCYKWQYRLTKAFCICLEYGDYVQIRNALIILIKLIHHFPVVDLFGNALLKRVEMIREVEKTKRPDIFTLATGYSGQLNLKKPSFVKESEFHQKQPTEKISIKKEPKNSTKETVNSTPKFQPNKEQKENISKPKNQAAVKESPPEKKDAKIESNRTAKKDDKSSKIDKNHLTVDKNKTELKNSTQSSPKRGNSRSRSLEPEIEREHKRRKVDNKIVNDKDKDRNDREKERTDKERDENHERKKGESGSSHHSKKGEDSTSSSPSSGRSHDKKGTNSSRKRESKESQVDSNSKKAKKDDQDPGKSKKVTTNEEKDSTRKTSENKKSSSSRRSRTEDK